MMSAPSPIKLAEPKLPYISKLASYNTPGQLEFQILSPHRTAGDHCFLCSAETSDKKTIVVKLTCRYSIELHAFCAQHGHAPEILGFKRLPGGWCAVAMEYLSGFKHPYESSHCCAFITIIWSMVICANRTSSVMDGQ